MAPRRPTRALLVVVGMVAIGACGGDDDDPAAGDSVPPATTSVGSVTPSEPSEPSAPTVPPTLVPASTQPERVDTTVPGTPGTGAPVGEDASANLQAAVADLAARHGVDPSTILVVSEQEVTWRDGSIGCPEPGVNYTQALVDGVRIVLDHDGTQYSYHAGGNRPIFYCEKPQLPGD